ncbi:MAG: hypothetical protein A2138_23230 [Deltaproteobacteria bacterium RBG_16_71_12]|nr:MAG: hypothetical protein A2138_23230 [Deltaproteobacteria bacterium RBG_16_71_12]
MLAALPVLLLSTPAVEPTAPPELVGEAVQASDAGRWCDALPLFLEIHRRSGSLRALFNAAEVAYAASDRVSAADLYRRIETNPGFALFEHKDIVRQRIGAVFRETQRAGPGVACPAPATRCGDWVLQAGEQCDDGNGDSGDGCDATCIASACGNGVRAPDEACDDGNDVDGDGCDAGCVVSACGNGVVAPGEVCDDGNVADGDGCDGNCTPTACGNGVRSKDEQCDDANAIDGDGCDRGCLVTRCGNGVVTAGERCDDGNHVEGDGCEVSCTATLRPAPALGLSVVGGSAAALVTAGVLLIIGAAPWVAHETAVADLNDRRERYRDDPDAAVAGVDDVRDTVEQADEDWGNYGLLCVASAGAIGGLGLLGVAGGSWLAATLTHEDDAPAAGTNAGGAP